MIDKTGGIFVFVFFILFLFLDFYFIIFEGRWEFFIPSIYLLYVPYILIFIPKFVLMIYVAIILTTGTNNTIHCWKTKKKLCFKNILAAQVSVTFCTYMLRKTAFEVKAFGVSTCLTLDIFTIELFNS